VSIRIFRTRVLPRLIAWAVGLLTLSWRVQRRDGHLLYDALDEGPVVVAFFHEDQLPLVALHRGLGFAGMASMSVDGELLARVIKQLGYQVVRGSSSRGGVRAGLSATRGLIDGGASIAVAVDGPRGPRREVQPGAVALAAMSGRPLVHLTVQARPAWRARSWDRFLLPLPFARVQVQYGLEPSPASGKLARVEATASLARHMRAVAADDGEG
jgi:lysophospholipid acyltransferase (LPLAT)-like uncharacterized protein